MRIQLLTAACAAALLATPALAQETNPADANPAMSAPVDAPAQEATPPAPEATPETTPEATAAEAPTADATTQTADATQGEDIVDVLRAQGQFSTLVSALDAAGLTATLEGNQGITILAPTDAAFEALPAGELDRLMAEENRDELRQVLLYHVINADVRRDQIENRRGPVQTGSGAQIMLDGGEGQLRADAATITNADLRGSNGAVLVLDAVLNPETSLAGQGDAETPAADAVTEESTEAPAEATTETPAETTAGEEAASMPSTPSTDTDPAEEARDVAAEEPTAPQA